MTRTELLKLYDNKWDRETKRRIQERVNREMTDLWQSFLHGNVSKAEFDAQRSAYNAGLTAWRGA